MIMKPDIETALRNKLTSDMKTLRQMIEGTIDENELLMLHGCLVEAEKIWQEFFRNEPPGSQKPQEASLLN